MALVIPPGFAHVSLQFRNTGDPDPWYVTWGIDISAAGGDTEVIAGVQAGAWEASMLGNMTTDTTMSGVQLRVGQDGLDPLTLFYPYSEPGLSSTAKLPSNCALLCTKVTLRPGRTGKGRFFVPNVLTESGVDNVGVIAGSTLSTLQTNVTDFFEYLASDSPGPATPMVLLHNAGAPGGTTPTEVTQLIVDGVISTQRRRLR